MSTHSNSSIGTSAVSTGETPVVRPLDLVEANLKIPPSTIFFAVSPIDSKLAWSSDLTLVHMIADLVRASAGTLASDADGILSATTGTALQALVLGVRAVRLATSYASYRPEGIGGFTVAIMAPAEAGESPEPALRRVLALPGTTGRILLAGDALQQLRNVPGLQAKKLPAPRGQAADIHELILPAITPDTKTAEIVALDAAPAPVRQPMPAEPTREMPVLLARDVADPAPAGRSKLLLAGGLAAALIVGGVAVKLLISKPAPVSTAPAIAPAVAPAVAPVGIPTPAPPQPTNPAAEVPPPIRRAVEPETRPTAKLKAKAPDDATPAPKPSDSDGPHGGFTADQLKAILDKADKLTANGKYEEAIRNYNVVLAADPGNGRAKAGKERAVTNMNMP